MLPAPVGTASSRIIAVAVLLTARGLRLYARGQRSIPQESTPATFAGSEHLRLCHATPYEDWLGSHHELAMQHAQRGHRAR